jgi:hypothetical protein
MSYPPQGGGWQQDQHGNWQQAQPGGWQDPAGGYADPASGQPAYVDPVSGQPTSYPSYPAQAQYPTSPGYGYQQQYQGYGAPVMAPSGSRTNGLSIAAMVLSLVGILTFWCYGVGAVFGLVGAIMGHVGRKQVTQRGEQGGGMAMAGIIIGWISVLLGVIAVAVYAYFFWWVANLPDTYPTTYSTS